MTWTRNRLYDPDDYKGKEINAPDKQCPCRPCWHLYHFPYWDGSGKRHDNFDCVTRANEGCPDPKPEPCHIFYNSKRFQRRKKGDAFKCLRCGAEVKIGIDKCNWIAVPYRKREKIIEYLKQKGAKV